jgi:putative ABC transport system permease protein
MIGNLMQDVRYAARTFAKQPGFVAVAVLTLALGIGANSAIFSVIYGVLLKPLALKDPERVVKLWESMANGFTGTVSPPNLKDWREQNSVFTQLAAYQFANLSLQANDSPSACAPPPSRQEFFEVMGVPPLLGRALADGEDQDGHQRVAVLSHQLWQRSFCQRSKYNRARDRARWRNVQCRWRNARLASASPLARPSCGFPWSSHRNRPRAGAAIF